MFLGKPNISYSVINTIIGLLLSTLLMYASEKKWPSWSLQGKVAGTLFVSSLLTVWLIERLSYIIE